MIRLPFSMVCVRAILAAGISMDGRTKMVRYKMTMWAVMTCLGAPAAVLAQDKVHRATPLAGDAVQEPATTCGAEPAAFVMPTTGVLFTLPPTAAQTQPLECAVPLPPAPVRPPAPSLFRMAAVPVGKSAPQQKWERARMGAVADYPGPWDELLAQANQVSSGNPVGMVNRWVNWHVRYRADSEGDEWASARTTLTRGFGDCEDFALAKMALLLALGIPSDEMYLVLLRDHRLDQHAVLIVNRDGQFYVLDNRTDMVLTAEEIDDYTPIVSFSGPFAWTYGELTG